MHPNRLLLFHQMCFLLLPGCCCARCVCTSRCQCTLRVLQSSSSSSSSSKPTLISIPLTLPTIRNPHLTEFFLFPVYKATLYPSRRLLLLLLPPPYSLTNPVAPCATSEIIICSIWKVSFQTQCASSTRHTQRYKKKMFNFNHHPRLLLIVHSFQRPSFTVTIAMGACPLCLRK